AGGDDLPRVAPPRGGESALGTLGDGRLRQAAARLPPDPARRARALRPARGLGEVRRRHRPSFHGQALGVISEYLDRLARELEFDPPLSRRVRREVEEHLREAAAADPGPDAEDRAIA